MEAVSSRLFLLPMLLIGLFVTGCDAINTEDDMMEEEDPVVTGAYSDDDIMLGGGIEADFELSLQEDEGNVSGDGVIANGATIPLDVSGTHDHPDISLTLSSSGSGDFTLTGDVSEDGDRISGELEGSGLDGVDVLLTRN